MLIYPAIDLYEGKAVRLFKGDYDQMTVYSDDPPAIAEDFVRAGAVRIHVVDLEGARDASTPNLDTVLAIKAAAARASVKPMSIASRKAPKTPNCAAAPSRKLLGLAISGPKSVSAPTPRNMRDGSIVHSSSMKK